jgi:hypothetical protein
MQCNIYKCKRSWKGKNKQKEDLKCLMFSIFILKYFISFNMTKQNCSHLASLYTCLLFLYCALEKCFGKN